MVNTFWNKRRCETMLIFILSLYHFITLGRYATCHDKMIDGELEDYWPIWQKLDTTGAYQTIEEFTFGIMYDDTNPSTVMAAQTKAMDNAILLREDILSETLSYLEMSLALLKECRKKQEKNVICLQPVIDWSLAFWGSAQQRLQNHKALYIMSIGRNVENMDMLLRFNYSYERVALAYDSLKRYCKQMPNIIDEDIEGELNSLIIEERFNLNDVEYKNKLLELINQLVKV